MIAFAAVAVAVLAQAATFNWSSTDIAYALDAAGVVDNGNYTAGTTKMKGKGTWSYILTIYAAGTDTVLGSANGSISFGTKGGFNTAGITSTTIDAIGAGVDVDYLFKITGTQTDLTARGKEATYDYTAASLATEISGSVTTSNLGNTKLDSAVPTSWTVSGIAAIPEPTSGLLLILGMAGLALRRKQK